MPKILLLCADSSAEWNEALCRKAMTLMPPGFAEENARFRRAQDRRNRILGRLLVLRGLAMLGALPDEETKRTTVRSLPQRACERSGRLVPRRSPAYPDGVASWSVDSSGRPYLAQPPRRADFNISHTEGAVVVALSPCGRIGVDVERRSGGEVEEYLGAFTENERSWILAGEGAKERMLRLWTRKEAILKAAGTGFSLAPSLIDVLEGEAVVGGVLYRVRELDIDLGTGGTSARLPGGASRRDAAFALDRGGFLCHIAMEAPNDRVHRERGMRKGLMKKLSEQVEILYFTIEEAVEIGLG